MPFAGAAVIALLIAFVLSGCRTDVHSGPATSIPAWGCVASRSVEVSQMGLTEIRARPCGGCGVGYDRFRCGLSFDDAVQAVKHSTDVDASGNARRFWGRRSVLRQLCRWKLDAWNEHLSTCGAGVIDASDAAWRVARGRWFITLDADARAHLEAEPGDELFVELDGDVYRGVLDGDHRVIVQANWHELHLPCSWVRISSRVRWQAFAENENTEEEAPF